MTVFSRKIAAISFVVGCASLGMPAASQAASPELRVRLRNFTNTTVNYNFQCVGEGPALPRSIVANSAKSELCGDSASIARISYTQSGSLVTQDVYFQGNYSFQFNNGRIALFINSGVELAAGRFFAWMEWTPDGTHWYLAQGKSIDGSADSGLLYFYGPDNIEVLAKVINACGTQAGTYYFLAATASTFNWRIKLQDVGRTGQTKIYAKQGTPFGPSNAVADFDGLRVCP